MCVIGDNDPLKRVVWHWDRNISVFKSAIIISINIINPLDERVLFVDGYCQISSIATGITIVYII